jgi:coenzyme F420-reducing hydrogenase alpha subunit
MLHAPDFLGYEDAIRMAKDYPEEVKRGLQLKKIGNDLVTMLGGREIHPINVRVGGFYKVPTRAELNDMLDPLKWARDAALETIRWTGSLPFPDLERDYEFVSLSHPDEYPFNEGRIVSTSGLDISVNEFYDYFEEEHVEHSTSLHSIVKGGGTYHVGPMARYNLNFHKLPEVAQEAAREAGLAEVCRNPFKSIVVRSVEILFAYEEAIRIIERYEMPDKPHVEVRPRAATGHGASEAPRGMLYHRYTIDDEGIIQDAKIVPPTSQNQKIVEDDLADFVSKNLDLPEDKLTWQCEQVVRNYDPCISCSCHFLKLEIDRE